MIVVDASVLIDALFSRNPERFVKAVNFLRHVEGISLTLQDKGYEVKTT